MTSLAIIQASIDKAKSAKEVANLIAEKYPELLIKEPSIQQFVRLLVQQ